MTGGGQLANPENIRPLVWGKMPKGLSHALDPEIVLAGFVGIPFMLSVAAPMMEIVCAVITV